jgi:GTP-binding protein
MPTPVDRAATPDPLVIRHLEFAGGLAEPGGWRPAAALPEVAVSGRSNVGKSSLINTLLHRKSFARVSQHPGKTREINFYRVNDQFYFVDLPGYGFARVSRSMRTQWARLIDGYLRGSVQLRGVVQLVDARHEPTPDDHHMLEALADIGVPTIICVTKWDKLRPAERATRLTDTARALGVGEAQLVPFSVVTGMGRDELAEAIVALVTQPAWRAP